MVNDEQDTFLIKEQLENDQEQWNAKLNLFFSFDVVNSTKYKNLNKNWPVELKNLLDTIRKIVSDSKVDIISTSILWRVIGDELIFVATVSNSNDLVKGVAEISAITQRISSDIQEWDTTKLLDIKSASWIAAVRNEMDNSDNYSLFDNILCNYQASSSKQVIRDYLGKDIDAGFRLKYYTKRRRLVISFELAYFLYKAKKEEKNHLYIMDYIKLKGVWNESLYPIIWYDNNNKKAFINSFKYDERVNNPIIEHFFCRQAKYDINDIDKKMIIRIMNKIPKENMIMLADDMYEVDKAIDKIYVDKDLKAKIDYIRSLLNNG